ncbi:MAG: sensor histidine kinase [Ignavibacteriae bacterium]|nr:sensor histidine kinase [Ignavibacteriota bacterium]
MEPTDIFSVFFTLDNPLIYGLTIIVLLVIIIYLIKKEYISPLRKNKAELELKNLKLMALFAEVDPDPVIRIDKNYVITELNKCAQSEFGNQIIGKSIFDIFENYSNSEGNEKYIEISYKDKYYSAVTKEIETFNFTHIYLRDITQRIKYEILIKQNQESLKQLKAKVETVNEEEKNRLGKELHDSVGQNLLMLKLSIEKLQNEKKRDELETNKMLNLIADLSNEIRDISHQLRPRILNEFGLVAGLTSIIDSINNKNHIKGFISTNYKLGTLNKEYELNIYRICQESISNIIKHSNCSEFFIQLIQEDEQIKLVISDDGKGFNVDEYLSEGRSSLGLLNIKERAENYEGKMNIISAPGEGTTIFIKFLRNEIYDKSFNC